MNILRISSLVLILLPLLTTLVLAQETEYEEQALEILRLYEDGQTDTAYWLVEPLKRNARFVPAALFVRAQMTPDDRALGLYREVIALEPVGPYADDAAYQLVRRYTAKRDSLAAWTWFGMLQSSFPQSPFVAVARELLGRQKTWTFANPDQDGEEIEATTATSGTSEQRDGEEDLGDAETAETVTEPTTPPVREPGASTSTVSGYALQVGLLPTKAAAQRRAAELREKGLDPDIFEKSVDGRTAFAVVVGPYESREKAASDKGRVSTACECGAFTVLVE